MASKLNTESIRGWLDGRKGWKRRSNRIIKSFHFSSVRDPIVCGHRVATLADTHDHHPDIDIRYDNVTITLSTHDAGGITEKDLALAEQIDFSTSSN